MALQLSVALRDDLAGRFETVIGASPTLEIRTGAPPANCGAADTGVVLATMTLPADWMGAPSAGAAALAGLWQDAAADAGGDAGHFRIKAAATTHAQGTVSQAAGSGGTGDIQLQQATVAIVEGQQVTVTAFTFTQGNA